ncbi:hypothetical protein [Pseudonocardia sp. D17]|uniref:hypothetical protein n=1 Tax=Pseudonocardia sp. D17 TaxID=882661 RepID=UPI002B36F53B|nr:hypothetical protein PSD17_39530 [Pseudonocardia sp. D17]
MTPAEKAARTLAARNRERMRAAVVRTVDEAPPLTPAQRDRIASIFLRPADRQDRAR